MSDVVLVMPTMSMTMTEGEVLVWHRNAGEAVRAGDLAGLVPVWTTRAAVGRHGRAAAGGGELG